jgi:hypothetical protein
MIERCAICGCEDSLGLVKCFLGPATDLRLVDRNTGETAKLCSGCVECLDEFMRNMDPHQ